MKLRLPIYRYVGWLLILLGPVAALMFGTAGMSRGDLMIIFAFLTVSGFQLIGMSRIIEELSRQ